MLISTLICTSSVLTYTLPSFRIKGKGYEEFVEVFIRENVLFLFIMNPGYGSSIYYNYYYYFGFLQMWMNASLETMYVALQTDCVLTMRDHSVVSVEQASPEILGMTVKVVNGFKIPAVVFTLLSKCKLFQEQERTYTTVAAKPDKSLLKLTCLPTDYMQQSAV